MREIKFRAYLTVEKKMVDIISINFQDEIFYYPNDNPDRLNDRPIEESFLNAEILQFTGLLDKNGKEIYEGDVIEIMMFDGDRYVPEIMLITWHDKLAKWALKDSVAELYGFADSNNKLKVIGNIHQNPELLK